MSDAPLSPVRCPGSGVSNGKTVSRAESQAVNATGVACQVMLLRTANGLTSIHEEVVERLDVER